MPNIPLKLFFLLCSLLISTKLLSKQYFVGPDSFFKSPNALYLAGVVQDFDTILLDHGTYFGQDALAHWTQNYLVFQGINGRPHLNANFSGINGKGIWVISGNHCKVDNLEFSNAKVIDQNGAGIRFENQSIEIINCYFHHCENGILSGNLNQGKITITHSEFDHCGYGDGYSHNLYIGRCDSLEFQFNYSHEAQIGHLIKSRAKVNLIYCNYFTDGLEGNSSRVIDLPNGGIAIISGNILLKGSNAENSNTLGYGKEGLTSNGTHQLYVFNNTFINYRNPAGLFVDFPQETSVTLMINNILAGNGTPYSFTPNHLKNNLISEWIDSIHFENLSMDKFQILPESPARNVGIDITSIVSFLMLPKEQYVHPTQNEIRPLDLFPDIGAYEHQYTSGKSRSVNDPISISPTITNGTIRISPNYDKTYSNGQITIYDSQGNLKLTRLWNVEDACIDISGFQGGIYFIVIQYANTQLFRQIIKL